MIGLFENLYKLKNFPFKFLENWENRELGGRTETKQTTVTKQDLKWL